MPTSFLINEKNLVKLLILFLTPFFVLVLVATFLPQLAYLLPFLCIS